MSSGSGSGVVQNLATPSPSFSTFPPPPISSTPTGSNVDATQRKRGLVLWLTLAAAVGMLAVVALGFGRDRGSYPRAAAAAPTTPFVDPTLIAAPLPPSPPTGAIPVSPDPVVEPTPPPAALATGSGGASLPSPRGKVVSTPSSHHMLGQKTMAAAPSPPPAVTASEETGFLTFDTYPWTRVTENGKVLGTTPLVHIALPAGTHTLTLENADQGIKQQYSVVIRGGDVVSRRLGLK